MALQGCPYIASGDNDTIDKISLEELQGCQYKETIGTEYPNQASLECEKRCIRDSVYYYQKSLYKGPQNASPAADPSLASNQWALDTVYYDTSLVTIVGPEKDGNFTKNFYIKSKFANIYYDSEEYLSEDNWSSKGWTLCKE